MKSVVITGADGAIGRELCREFKCAGYYVIAIDKSPPSLGDVNLDIDFLKLADSESYAEIQLHRLSKATSGFHVSALINNAALQVLSPIIDLDLKSLKDSLSVNFLAPFILSKSLLDNLIKENGAIINIGSIHSKLTKPNFLAYSASKSALVGLTQALAVEIGHVVRVNIICPAAIKTKMLEEGFVGREEQYALLKDFHPSKRIGEPDEVAKTAVFLASDAARFINGAIIPVDGGIGVRLHDPT